MKFGLVTAKVAFFLFPILFWGCVEIDRTPPSIVYINITEGMEIKPPYEIVINFDEDVNAASLYEITIPGHLVVAEAMGSTVFIRIPRGASPGRYTLIITGGEDLAGNTMKTKIVTFVVC